MESAPTTPEPHLVRIISTVEGEKHAKKKENDRRFEPLVCNLVFTVSANRLQQVRWQ